MSTIKIFKSQLFENFISLGAIQGINYILPLITIPFLFNRLGVENYGLINFSFAFIQYFIVLTDFGFGLSGTRYIAQNRNNKKKVNDFLNSACSARLILMCISFLILSFCIFLIPVFSKHKLFTYLFFGQILGNCFNPVWFFQGMEKMKFNTIIHVVTRIISILPLFILVNKPDDYIYIPVCYSTGSIVSGLLSLVLIHRKFAMTYYFTSIKEIWAVLVDSSKYFFSRISASILANTNTFVLGLTLGNTVVGYYSLAEKIYFALNSIYGPVNGAIFPYMTKNKNLELFKKILLWGIVGNILFLIAFYFVFPFIIPYVFHDFSKYSFTVMEILLLSSIVALPSTFLGYPFLASWGHPNFTNYSLIITSIMHVIILYVLYLFDSISIYSVAWLMCFSELFLLMYRIYGVKKYKLWK